MVLIKKNTTNQPNKTDKLVADLGNFCVKITDFFVFCDKTQKERERRRKE